MGNTIIKVYLNFLKVTKKKRVKVSDIENQCRTSNIFQIRNPQREIIETAKRKLSKKQKQELLLDM